MVTLENTECFTSHLLEKFSYCVMAFHRTHFKTQDFYTCLIAILRSSRSFISVYVTVSRFEVQGNGNLDIQLHPPICPKYLGGVWNIKVVTDTAQKPANQYTDNFYKTNQTLTAVFSTTMADLVSAVFLLISKFSYQPL